MRFSLGSGGRKSYCIAIVLAVIAQFAGSAMAAHGKLKVLHSFCIQTTCLDGANPGPQSPLLIDALGNLYGTTATGGDTGAGTIFELQPRAANRGWTFTRLYSFCPDAFRCPDGVEPYTNLIMDKNGNLYGVTAGGGAASAAGVIYELMPHEGSWTQKTLYTFCTESNCPRGGTPAGLTYTGEAAGELYDGVSALYGIARHGGRGQQGLVFSLAPEANSKWKYSIVYAFCAQKDCRDGSLPSIGLTMDKLGNLFGATSAGGKKGKGILFELSQDGAGWIETVLYDFCSKRNCIDGVLPGKPLLTADGALFGTTSLGGTAQSGVLYKFVPSTRKYKALYSFCSQTNCADGRMPNDGLTMNAAGDLYGTMFDGGSHSSSDGIIFKFSRNTFSVIYDFCSQENCIDGQNPYAGVVVDKDDNIFGVTEVGGAGAAPNGTVFELKP